MVSGGSLVATRQAVAGEKAQRLQLDGSRTL